MVFAMVYQPVNTCTSGRLVGGGRVRLAGSRTCAVESVCFYWIILARTSCGVISLNANSLRMWPGLFSDFNSLLQIYELFNGTPRR